MFCGQVHTRKNPLKIYLRKCWTWVTLLTLFKLKRTFLKVILKPSCNIILAHVFTAVHFKVINYLGIIQSSENNVIIWKSQWNAVNACVNVISTQANWFFDFHELKIRIFWKSNRIFGSKSNSDGADVQQFPVSWLVDQKKTKKDFQWKYIIIHLFPHGHLGSISPTKWHKEQS